MACSLSSSDSFHENYLHLENPGTLFLGLGSGIVASCISFQVRPPVSLHFPSIAHLFLYLPSMVFGGYCRCAGEWFVLLALFFIPDLTGRRLSNLKAICLSLMEL